MHTETAICKQHLICQNTKDVAAQYVEMAACT